MNKQFIYLIGLILFFGTSCFEDPQFSEIPEIDFRNIYFSDLDGESDSLVLTFYFEDGLGDIGLLNFENTPPFHKYNPIIDSRDSAVTFSAVNVTPPLYIIDSSFIVNRAPIKVLFSETDNRPSFDCNEYQYISIARNSPKDTFYISENPFHNNIYIDFFRKRNNEYTLINFATEFGNSTCNSVDFVSRIPIFEPESIGEPLSGTISYAMISLGFKQIFRNDIIKIRFYIYDRSLNKSNIAETPDFVLEDITR